jgi:hypothetical protein
VITAPSLAVGEEYIQEALGVRPVRGGEHASMGTHNSLLRLGDTMYLEVIAVNPAAPKPNRPRLFCLDEIGTGDRPRLATWVARTDDLRTAIARTPLSFGEIMPMERGSLKWSITIPQDGSMPVDGIAPTLIQWETDCHPAGGLAESGCSLIRLEGFHREAKVLTSALQSLGFKGVFDISDLHSHGKPYLVAHIRTPDGVRQLGGL